MKDNNIIPKPTLTRCIATTSSLENNNIKELNIIQNMYQKIYLIIYNWSLYLSKIYNLISLTKSNSNFKTLYKPKSKT